MTKAFFLTSLGLLASGVALAPVTAGVPNRWPNVDPDLRQAFERTVYAVHDEGSHWHSQNRAQRLDIEFDGEGASLRAREAVAAFHLAGYGYGDQLHEPGRAQVMEDANRVEYRRAELTEWFVNGEKGLEQGFTFPRRPSGAAGEPLTIALNLTGDLTPHLTGGAVTLEGRDGTVLRYSGLSAIDADGRTLPSKMEVQGTQVRLLVEDTAAKYPLIIDPTWTTELLLPPSGASSAGSSVAMTSSIAVVGDPGASAAYVYTYSNPGSGWSYQTTLTASDGGGSFGTAVAISGTTAVVTDGQGAAYVFTQSGSEWAQQQKLTVPGASGFGNAVAIDGDTIVVGYPRSNEAEGAAYVFTRTGSTWGTPTELLPLDGSDNDDFGTSVAIDGTTILIGSIQHQVDGIFNAGAAYVFTQSGGNWTEQAELSASDASESNFFGQSVSISGTTAVVGAFQALTSGAAYVFSGSGSSWTQQNELYESDPSSNENDQFGWSVAISGGYVIVGAPSYAGEDDDDTGHVYIFDSSGNQVAELNDPDSDNGNNYDEFGLSVAGTQGQMIAGAPYALSAGLVTILYPPPSLSISATHTAPDFQSGPVNLSLTVVDDGGPTAATATVSDAVPSDLTINAAPGCSISGQSVTCTLTVGAVGTNTFNVYTTAAASAASSLSNTATLADSTDTVSTSSSLDTITIGSQAPPADSSLSQVSISGSTNGGACASGNNTLTATVQLENTSGSTMTNPYAVNVTLSGLNTLISNTSNASTVAASGTVTFTFDIQLATCNTFHLGFDVRSN